MSNILMSCLCFSHQTGFDNMDPFIPVSVPNYSEKEFESCYLYYLDRHWLQHPQCKWWWSGLFALRKKYWSVGLSVIWSIINWIIILLSSGQTEEGKKELVFLSNRNPKMLERICASLWSWPYLNHTLILQSPVNIQISMSVLRSPCKL